MVFGFLLISDIDKKKKKKEAFVLFLIVKGLYRITHVASQALDRAKPGGEEKKKSPNSRSFKRLVCHNITPP
jgi:hypothetical protein